MPKGKKRPLSAKNIAVFTGTAVLFLIIVLIAVFQIIKDKPVWKETHPDQASQQPAKDLPENTGDTLAQEAQEIDHTTRKESCYTFLLAASDQSSGNADVIMVATYNAVKHTAGIISIPRDTLVDPAATPAKFPKINSSYHAGAEGLGDVISHMLGIPIDYYFTIDTDGFVALVDEIGGIDFDVPIHMSYDDPTQDLSIHFEPGVQHLSGSEALAVCRLRSNQDGTIAYPDYDIGRTRTQQALLKTIAAKVLSQPAKIREYIDIFSTYCSTDLSLGNILWLAESAIGMDPETEIQTATLPGDGETTYRGVQYCYELYTEDALSLVNELINPYAEDRTLDDLNIFQADK